MSLTPKWIKGFFDIAQTMQKGIKDFWYRAFIDDMKLEVALTSLHEEEYKSDEVKSIVSRIKEDWSHSPETASQFAESLMTVVSGQLASLQLQNMIDIKVDDTAPVSQAMFKQLGIITDISLLSSTLSVIGEICSLGQIDTLGQEIRSYLDYSGLSQITGFGYGMMLSNAVSPLIAQEINSQVRPSLLDPDRALNMFYREIVDEPTLASNMEKQGFTDIQIEQLKAGYKFYPNPTDFIRFAVREVFNEEVVDKWGYDQAFPSNMEPYVNKAGMDMDVLKWYWRAHWELPSPNMGYEMLHRGLLSKDELTELLQLADFAPGYIDKMIGISYTPYTRVDAKRMFNAGVLDDVALVKAYTDIGYSEEMAQNLLEWVKIDSQASEKDLSKALIIQAYSIGLIDRPATVEYIEGLGYDADESELIIAIEDNKDEQKQIELTLKMLRTQFIKSVISTHTFEEKATLLGLSTVKINQELEKAEQEKASKISLPSKADLEKWLKNGLISEAEFESRMLDKGYQYADVQNYLKAVVL